MYLKCNTVVNDNFMLAGFTRKLLINTEVDRNIMGALKGKCIYWIHDNV